MLRAQRLQYRVAWPTAGRIDASAFEESARFAAGALLLGVAYYVMAWFGVSSTMRKVAPLAMASCCQGTKLA